MEDSPENMNVVCWGAVARLFRSSFTLHLK